MDLQTALDLGRDSMLLVLTLSAPVLAIGMIVGLAVSLVQAVTQLQEQTLTFVPKIAAMAIAAILFVPWITTKMLEFAAELFGRAPW
jgi:flagellar biosynthetic protein FliQ